MSYQVFNALGEIVRTESRSTCRWAAIHHGHERPGERSVYVSVQSGDMRATRKVTLTR